MKRLFISIVIFVSFVFHIQGKQNYERELISKVTFHFMELGMTSYGMSQAIFVYENIDNSQIFGLCCASTDSVTKSQLDFYNTEVKHGYFDSVNSNNKLSYDDVFKLADMERFPHEMLTKKNIRFKTKKINVANYGECYYYVLQFKHFPGVYLNGKMHVLYCPSKSEYFVFGEYVSNISTEEEYLLITNNCRGNISYDRLLYSKEHSRFLLECE